MKLTKLDSGAYIIDIEKIGWQIDEIKIYNREDCESTYFLREWLLGKKPKDSHYVIKKDL